MTGPRRKPRLARGWSVGAIGLVVVVAAAAWWSLSGGSDADSPASSTTTVNGNGCDGVDAQSIELGRQVVDAPDRFCIVVTDPSEVTVGAASLTATDSIALELFDAEDHLLASAQSAPSKDPQITQVLEPGVYVGVVTSATSPMPKLLVFTALYAAPAPTPSAGANAEASVTDNIGLPTLDECGAGDLPSLTSSTRITRDDSAPWACLTLTEDTWLKAGLESASDGVGGPDLRMSIFEYGPDGKASLLRSVDDVLRFDPEMSIDLPAGDYLLEASAWNDATIGEPEMYVDTNASYFRQGTPSPQAATLTTAQCDDAVQAAHEAQDNGGDTAQGDSLLPVFEPDSTTSVRMELGTICLDVPQQQRLTLETATLTDQDLALEVLGFADDGTAYRLSWTDENPYSDVLGATDPLLDITFPAGVYTVQVDTYYGEPAANFDVRFVPSTPQQ